MSNAATSSSDRMTARYPTALQRVTAVLAVVFLLVGILGFIPGVTTHYGDMTFAGQHSMAMLFGVFMVSVLHNIVHLLFGVVGLLAARTQTGSRLYLGVGGLVYLVLWLFGLVVDKMSSANFVPLNTADNWLHLVLALGMLVLGFALGFGPRDTDPDSRS